MGGESPAIVELYKLHAELADRVSQRREGANRLYVSLLAGLAVIACLLAQFGAGGETRDAAMILLAVMGVVLSVSWWVVIRSYRQLNSGKFRMLHELEEQLPYRPFSREWQFLGEGKDLKLYSRLTTVESILPLSFAVLFLALFLVFLTGPASP